MKKNLQPLTPAALYARVSSDRQDVDLSVSAQLRALKDYAKANGYSVAREYVDEAESGRVADRPQFREMIEEGSQPKAPFEVILVWKFSRFTRKREHAVAFKSMLRRWTSCYGGTPPPRRWMRISRAPLVPVGRTVAGCWSPAWRRLPPPGVRLLCRCRLSCLGSP